MKTRIVEGLASIFGRGVRCGGVVVLLVFAAFVAMTPQQAQAQSSDTWKSVAIIGGSTAAGAIIGHKVGGGTGTYVGAAIGAGAGYAIDHKRRQREYNNGYYGDSRYGDPNGYYGNDPYYGNSGYYGGNSYPNGSGYQTSSYRNNSRCSTRR